MLGARVILLVHPNGGFIVVDGNIDAAAYGDGYTG
jgi:hypothetical protein